MDQHIQISFKTKAKRYAVPSTPITLPISSSSVELNKLVHDLLSESDSSVDGVDFTFFVGDEFLNTTIEDHLSEKQISLELLEIEYCEKQRAPCFSEEIRQDDLISCVSRRGNYVLTGSYDGTVRLWTVENPEPIFSLQLDEKVKCLEWLTCDLKNKKEATFITGGFDQAVRLWVWNTTTNNVEAAVVCRGHSETVMSLAAQKGQMDPEFFASGSWDGTVKVWSATPECTDLFEETGGIAHTRKSTEKVPTRVPHLTLAGHRETVTKVCWNSTNATPGNQQGLQLISGSWDHTIRLWDCQISGGDPGKVCGTEVRSVVASHAVHDIDVATQGVLSASSDNRVRVYDLRSREALVLIGFHGHTGWLTAVAWAPHRDDQFVTGSIDRSVRLWDTRNTKSSLYDLLGHTEMVTDVDWAPAIELDDVVGGQSRHFILSSSADGTVKIYQYPA